ncbi:unnamed protein product, partial [Schistosoma margrebowiei]
TTSITPASQSAPINSSTTQTQTQTHLINTTGSTLSTSVLVISSFSVTSNSSGENIPTTPSPPTNTTTTQSTTKSTTITAQPQVDVLSTTTTTATKSSNTTIPTYDGVPTYSFVEFSLATRPSTAIAPVMLPLVSTKFNVKSNLYNQVNDTPVEWIEEYSNTDSPGYANLKSKYCDLLTYYLKQGDSNAADGASCEKVTFTPVTSTRPDGTVIRSVQGDTMINVPTTTGTQLTSSQLYGLFINGYNKTSTSPSSIKLNALDVQRTSGTVTCSQFTNPCGEHATCRDSPPGITCFCNSMWKDMNPNDPGKQCALHPAAIALIVLASLLLLAALILLLICLLRRRRRRNSSILASTDLATLNKLKETKSWRSKLDKNKIQLDPDQSISMARASVTDSPIALTSIPASPVPLTGLPMPLTPTASNMIDGLPQRVGRAFHSNTTSRVTAYGELSSDLATSCGVRQGCPISPFLFNVVTDLMMEITLSPTEYSGIDLQNGGSLIEFKYADDVVLLGEDADKMHSPLIALCSNAGMFGMRFSLSPNTSCCFRTGLSQHLN